MRKDYAFLSPIQVGPMKLKNRIIYPAMGKSLADDEGYVTDRYVEYFRTIAKGGVALITTGIMVIDPSWHYISVRQPWLSDDKFIPGLKRVAEAVHREDCRIFFQPWQSGQAGQPTGGDAKPVTVNDLSREDIRRIQDQWVEASRRAKEAGADGIEFHLAHTYLPSQFLSPYFNHRKDEYGSDTVENAMRFSLEIIDRIRESLVDERFSISAKINGDDFVEGGTTIQRTKEACRLLEKAGVVMITVNGGGALTKITGMSDNGAKPEGWKVPFAQAVKEVVRIPVAASGSLRHPAYVESIIREGKCDLAAIGRGILAEPEWVKKCREGREEEMRYCISCMFCFSRTPEGVSGCSVNPFAKRELEKPVLVKNGGGRRVIVAGAGPAGLEAAVTLAQRGFSPVILEKEKEIGGLVALAARPPHKQKIQWMLDYYKRQLDKWNIPVCFETEATPEVIRRYRPEAVILATGSREAVPDIPGLRALLLQEGLRESGFLEKGEKEDKEPEGGVVTARQMFRILERKEVCCRDIIVLGGGLTGVELAHMLRVRGNQVRVLELMEAPANPSMEQKLALEAAREDGVEVFYEKELLRIRRQTDGWLLLSVMDRQKGREQEEKAQLVICAMGIRSENAMAQALSEEYAGRFYAVGDCAFPGNISTAVSAGADAGYGLLVQD